MHSQIFRVSERSMSCSLLLWYWMRVKMGCNPQSSPLWKVNFNQSVLCNNFLYCCIHKHNATHRFTRVKVNTATRAHMADTKKFSLFILRVSWKETTIISSVLEFPWWKHIEYYLEYSWVKHWHFIHVGFSSLGSSLKSIGEKEAQILQCELEFLWLILRKHKKKQCNLDFPFPGLWEIPRKKR